MRMLEQDDADADAPVTHADQLNINKFSRLNSRYDEIVDEMASVRRQLEDVEEVETELELMDEDELVMYKLDSSFLRLPAAEVVEMLHATLDKLRQQSDALDKEKDESEQEMDRLKKVLYAKFGKSINLERD